ncbi:MAG: type II secretion system F family protein, partial [Gammaproteobacteria bacterium]|nr:type II secretion system F family protein [Gammaproteobacteria bacterium]
LGACVTGFALPHLFVSHLCRRRQRAFTDQFPEGIELIIRGLRTGQPLIESAAYMAREMPKPIGPEFQGIVDSVRLGNTLDDALRAALLRIDTPEFRFFATAVTIQQTTGGNLAETLGNLADMLRKRQQMKQRIKAIVSEPKASAWILGSLPFIMFAILFIVEASYVMTLFDDPRGHLLVGLALLSQFIGVVIMVRMVKFKI